MNNVKRLVLTGLIAVTSIGGAACSGGNAAVQQERVIAVRGSIVQTVSADGSLSLTQQRKLSFGIDGKITQINVQEGDKVTKGQVLAKLDTASLERVVKTAELAVKLAEAERQQADAGVQIAQADLKAAEVGVQTARSDQQATDTAIKTAQAGVEQAQLGVKTAEASLEQASDAYKKITYPYTYSTFALDIPDAVASINDAQIKLNQALNGMIKPGLTAEESAVALRNVQDALDKLAQARTRLERGQGTDVFTISQNNTAAGFQFSSTLVQGTDFWTLRNAQLNMDKARNGLDVAKSAVQVAQLSVDSANNAAAKAKLGVDIAAVTVDKAKAGITNAQALLSKTQSGAEKARYDLESARDTLDKATISAPFDGIIAEVDAKIGDVVPPVDFARTIFQIIDPRRMEFTIKVDELDIALVQAGQEAIVSLDALPNLKPAGKVVFVSPLPKVEGGVVQYEVKVGFDVPEGVVLKSGMSSSADITIARHDNAILVPNRAVGKNKAGKPTVKLLVNGQIQEREVETGISSNTETEIRSGLNEGDTVVIETPAK